jgi:hypothetical protein
MRRASVPFAKLFLLFLKISHRPARYKRRSSPKSLLYLSHCTSQSTYYFTSKENVALFTVRMITIRITLAPRLSALIRGHRQRHDESDGGIFPIPLHYYILNKL